MTNFRIWPMVYAIALELVWILVTLASITKFDFECKHVTYWSLIYAGLPNGSFDD
jgi:hypothetical protein